MNIWKSWGTILALAAGALVTAGCHSDHYRGDRHRIHEPAGAESGHYHYRDGRYYAPRDERNRQWYYHGDRYHHRYHEDRFRYRD